MSKPVALSLSSPAKLALGLSSGAKLALRLQKPDGIRLNFLGGATLPLRLSGAREVALVFHRYAGGGASLERSIEVDPSRPIAYVGYATRIKRLDYSTWPPTTTSADTADLAADWPRRATLTYT